MPLRSSHKRPFVRHRTDLLQKVSGTGRHAVAIARSIRIVKAAVPARWRVPRRTAIHSGGTAPEWPSPPGQGRTDPAHRRWAPGHGDRRIGTTIQQPQLDDTTPHEYLPKDERLGGSERSQPFPDPVEVGL